MLKQELNKRNKEYQDFVVRQKEVEAKQAIGIEQAKNLSNANINIYATNGDIPTGVSNATSMLSPKTGFNLGSTIEAFANTEIGKEIVDKFIKRESK